MSNATLEVKKSSPSEALGNNVRYLRFRSRMSLSELSRRSGLSRQILYKVEEGSANLRMDSLARIAKAFGVDACDLLG